MKTAYDKLLMKWQREHPGRTIPKSELATIISSLWDKYLTSEIKMKAFQAIGNFDISIESRSNHGVVDPAKFDPRKLARYYSLKVTMSSNSDGNPNTFSFITRRLTSRFNFFLELDSPVDEQVISSNGVIESSAVRNETSSPSAV